MTEVRPLHTPDFTIQTLDMGFYQTPLNTPIENIRRIGMSATVISETHQFDEIDTDKPNFIPFLSANQANATDSSQDCDPSFPEELDDLIFESPNSTPTPTQLPECLQVPSFQNTEPDTSKNLEPTSTDERSDSTKTIGSEPLIEEIVSQDELEISQELEDETPLIQIKRPKRSTDETTSHRTNKRKTPTLIKKLRKKAKTRRKIATILHLKKSIRLLKSTEDFRRRKIVPPKPSIPKFIRYNYIPTITILELQLNLMLQLLT